MATPNNDHMKYWGIAGAVLLVILWFAGDMLLPFIIGAAIAYFLDPVADRLETLGLSRTMATMVITLVALMIFVLMAVLVVPTLINQAGNLVAVAPELAKNFINFLTERFPTLLDQESSLRSSVNSIGATVQERGGELFNTAVASAASLLNLLILFVIVPVVAVYLLLDWDRMVAKIDSLLPRDHAPTIRRLARDIDKTLAGFIRGMGTVSLILGTYYAVALMLVGLQFGLIGGYLRGGPNRRRQFSHTEARRRFRRAAPGLVDFGIVCVRLSLWIRRHAGSSADCGGLGGHRPLRNRTVSTK